MSKCKLIFAAAIFAAIGFSSCKNDPPAPDFTKDKGVIINGIKWATRNVDKPGTFVANPENTGWLYQWNRNVGWSNADPLINTNDETNWNNSVPPTVEMWESANDPSPKGWRVASFADFQTLFDEEKVSWTIKVQNGVTGFAFTDKTNGNTLFIPQTCGRSYNNKLSSDLSMYWTNTIYDGTDYQGTAVIFDLGDDRPYCALATRSCALSLRSVAAE